MLILLYLCLAYHAREHEKLLNQQLTTASQNGGWVSVINPGAYTIGSQLLAYTIGSLLPWLANPGKPAMSPHAEGKTGTHHTEHLNSGKET